jgi:hypothetical protein
MNRFRRFMYGRYGFDQLSQFILWMAIIVSFVGTISRFYVVTYAAYFILAYAVFRILSKNISRRTQENYKFMGVKNSIVGRLQKIKRTIGGTKTHKYYLCPNCKQTIRVPKGKGKISITCPKCRTEFIKRT